MRLASISVAMLLAITGTAYFLAMLVLVATRVPLGSPGFFATAAVAAVAYLAMLARVWHEQRSRHLLLAAFAFAAAFRAPLALAPVGSDNDMVRYVWDGRVQRLGYNPYLVVPADPRLASTHTPETAAMPSRRVRTPYPPAAQLFFRLVVGFHDSTRAMKLALVACDLLTVIVMWRWLVASGRSEWLALAYAWHPLVVLEVAHSGHIDALGALWITAAAYWLTRRRTALAAVAVVFAIATKLLAVVLLPLFVRRILLRDALLGAVLLFVIYLPFMSDVWSLLGSAPHVVYQRFNGPVFRAAAGLSSPEAGAALALLVGMAAAYRARLRLSRADPAAWAWPMALSLICAPVIYPWYLISLTPFLFTSATLPIHAWSLSVLSAYVAWWAAEARSRWTVPGGVMAFEYGVLIIAVLITLWRRNLRE